MQTCSDLKSVPMHTIHNTHGETTKTKQKIPSPARESTAQAAKNVITLEVFIFLHPFIGFGFALMCMWVHAVSFVVFDNSR